MTTRAILLGALIASCAGAPPARTQRAPAQWGTLVQGPHAVGFRHAVELDRARVFGSIPDGTGTDRAAQKTARPILIGIWYPAQSVAPRMRYRDYLSWPLAGTPSEALALDLAMYGQDILAAEALGAKPPLTATQRRHLEELLDAETAAVRDAKPVAGRFPLIIYRPGGGGTIEENAVLFEYLASHGYVVAAGAFLNNDGVTLGARLSTEDSLLDVHYTIGFMARQPGVDARRVALVGFSAGAQNMLLVAAANPVADAVISLDTTWDYPANQSRIADDPAFTQFTDTSAHSAVPVLAFAARGANYAPFATMKHASRIYVTLDDLDHDDFTWRGAGGARYRSRAPDLASPAVVRAQYDVLCVYVRRFLDATLAGTADAVAFLAREPQANGIQTAGVHVARQAARSRPPTERELLDLTIARGAAAAFERCDVQARSGGDSCADAWAEKIGDLLLTRRRAAVAVPLLDADVRRRPAAVFSALRLAQAHRTLGNLAAARLAYAEVLRRASIPDKAESQYTFDEIMLMMWREQATRSLAELDAAGSRSE